MSPWLKLVVGIAATAGSAWIFHGPAGYGQRLIDGLDAKVQPLVVKQGVPAVTASFPRPLSRDLRFAGPANAFQRTGFVEVVRDANVRGLRTVGWSAADAPGGAARLMPLFVESLVWQLGAFAAGLLAAYSVFGRNTRNYR